MMAKSLFVVLVALLSAVYADEFTCGLMGGDHLAQTKMAYQINTGSNIYQPGSQVQVKLGYQTPDHQEQFKFIIQAFKAGSTEETVGSWVFKNNEQTMQCDNTNMNAPDTLYIDQPVTSYTVTWKAPEGDKSGDAVDVEFFVVFIDADGDKHRLLSIGMSPAQEPSKLPPTVRPDDDEPIFGDDDEDDLHGERTEDQMKMDAEKKFIEEIDEENRASEDDWNKEEIAEMRLRQEEEHKEEMEYESLLRQEEEERLARIRDEIRDKEEYDRMVVEKQIQEGSVHKEILIPENEEVIEIIDQPTSSSVKLVSGLLGCLLLALIHMMI